ncbi:MAG: PHP domain-containing protein [Anaerolineae bacterium]|nr:PHP domain-containing protein [Anaerolineae bacterium]
MSETWVESTRVDLHLHSTASDGQFTPTELVHMSLKKGLVVIALTDHDTTEGVQEATQAAAKAESETALVVIPGVEISTDVPGQYEIHILGYYIDLEDAVLQQRLATMRESRLSRARAIWERLDKLGHLVSWERVLVLAGDGSVGRPHIAQVLVEAGYAKSIQDAFQKYIGRAGQAYVPRPKLRPQEAIELIRDAGGVPVLAHPSHVIEHLPELVRAGLMGLEVYYNGYPDIEVQFLKRLAEKHDLIVTGGSDFHGPDVMEYAELGGVYVPWDVVETLQRVARQA